MRGVVGQGRGSTFPRPGPRHHESLEPKFMVSYANRTVPRHPILLVLIEAGLQGSTPGAAL